MTSVNRNVPRKNPIVVSPGECLSRHDQLPILDSKENHWNFWHFLTWHRRNSERSFKNSIFGWGKERKATVLSRLASPVTDLELNAYFSSLTSSYKDRVFIGDAKINQLHVGDGTFRSPSAPPALLFQMIANGKVIFLTRNNLLEAYLSGLRATQSNVWYLSRKNDKQRLKPAGEQSFYVSPEQALWGVNVLEDDILLTKKWLDRWGDSVLHVVYENLFDSEKGEIDQKQFQQIGAFCGLWSHLPWETDSLRNTNRTNLSFIKNRAELQHYFCSHGAGHWFSSEADSALEPAA